LIQNGTIVSIEYTLLLEDGLQIDSNVGEPPLLFVVGQGQVFPALENALLGLNEGDTKKVTLKPEDAYGPIVPEAFREVELAILPEASRHIGAIVGVKDPQSADVFPVRVHEIKEDKAVLDFNHPLAGRTLQFDLKIVHAE
jgi:FKBP-type peptidyl-prolyl cis-trans isomerase SlyD